MASVVACTRFGELSPVPFNAEGKRDAKFTTVQLPALNLKFPPIPKTKHQPAVLAAADQTLASLRSGLILMMENAEVFPVVLHPSIPVDATLEVVRCWWGFYRTQGKLIAGLTAEFYVGSTDQVVEYLVYMEPLTKKTAAAMVQHLISHDVYHVIVKVQ
jgi:hypothetical protein